VRRGDCEPAAAAARIGSVIRELRLVCHYINTALPPFKQAIGNRCVSVMPGRMIRLRLFLATTLLAASAAPAPAPAQELPNEGQGEAAYQVFLAGKPNVAAEVRSFEDWLRRKHVHGILPTWQLLRTATMWSECNGPPFQVPPRKYWPNVASTLRFVRLHVLPSVGPVQAVSGYRNPGLNICARGSANSAHRDYSALDLVPLKPLDRRQIFDRMCRVHRRKGPAGDVGLGFYAFTRFHVDTRSFRRWGSAGPLGNESPCAVIERGEDPLAPPLPQPVTVTVPAPPVSPARQEVPSNPPPVPDIAMNR
jgi:hypothetical protein